MNTASLIGSYNPSTVCDSSLAGHYNVKNANTMYFELENAGSVNFCIQTASQQSSGGCGTASGSVSKGPSCPSNPTPLTFYNPTYYPDQCYTIQQTANGMRISTNQQGWIAADLLSKNSATVFYVTVESLTGTAAGIGITEIQDDAGCSASDYSRSWVGSSSGNCWGDYVTFYTTKPPSSTSIMTATMTIGRTYRYTIVPNTGSATLRCGAVIITGIIGFITIIISYRYDNQ